MLPTSGLVVRPGKLVCIGRNYAKHAAEMKSDVPENPVIFLKPSTALVGQGGKVILPPMSREVHHEIELVVAIGRGGKQIPINDALNHVDGYALGLDMTARDLQEQAKLKGLPWSISKGFDTFAPLGPLAKAHDVGDPQQLEFELRVNGEVRQKARTADMIFSVAFLISYCSSMFTLLPGDLIFTGTPDGVGPVVTGDLLEASSPKLPELRVKVKRPA
jgi:2-keto-4-pentenoate hydratase/2-oxohepta-3-ene-1,7-dioic acid hydratase in catechol pathway